MGKNQSIAGLILGIVGIVFAFGPISAWLCVIALPVAIVGLVLSVVGGKKLKAEGQPAGIATAGLVVGIVAVVFAAISFFTCGICVIFFATAEEAAKDAISSLAK